MTVTQLRAERRELVERADRRAQAEIAAEHAAADFIALRNWIKWNILDATDDRESVEYRENVERHLYPRVVKLAHLALTELRHRAYEGDY